MATPAATPVSNGLYKSVSNGIAQYTVLPNYNVGSGFTKVTDPQEVRDYITHLNSLGAYTPGNPNGVQFDAQGVAKQAQAALDKYLSDPTSEYVLDQNGTFTTQKTIDSTAAHEAAVAAGTERNIGTAAAPLYVTVGSPADNLNKGLVNGTVDPQNPQQQFAASNQGPAPAGTTPVAPPAPGAPVVPPAPNQPAVQAAGAGSGALPAAPGGGSAAGGNGANQALNQALQQVYAKRPDLQAVYNPDGSAKNVNDPKIAGVPTLADWARKYGVNEEEAIRNAINYTPQTQNPTPDGAAVLNNYGVATPDPHTDPFSTFVNTYKQLYSDLGLTTLESQIKDFGDQLQANETKKAEEIAKTNENPWLSESLRAKEIQATSAKYDAISTAITDKTKLMQSMLDQGRQEAQFVATTAVNITHNQAVLDQQVQLKAMDIAATQAKADQTATEKTVKIGGVTYQYDPQSETYKPIGGGDNPTGPSTGSLTAAQVARVNAIIKANPGEYGHAADEIDKEFGAGTATKADALLKTAYLIPDNAIKAQQLWNSQADSEKTLANWNAGLTVFENAHPYNKAAAAAAWAKYVPKPSSTGSRAP